MSRPSVFTPTGSRTWMPGTRLHKAGHDDLTRIRAVLVEPSPRLVRPHPFKFRQLVPEPGELPLGVMAGVGAADFGGLLARDLAAEVADQGRHAMGLHRRQQRIEFSLGQ